MSGFYGDESFDVVVANGVIGWGLNEQAGFEQMMAQCHRVLKPGGLLILGYNDTPERAPYPVDIGHAGCSRLSCRRFRGKACAASYA